MKYTFNLDFQTATKIANIAHETNRAFCVAMGDQSQLDWDNCPQWQKDSAINGVYFTFENPDAPPSASHENWLKEKLENGWVYGEVKDPEAKTHPCCVPYDELPTLQKAKDHIFKAIVKTSLDLIQQEF